MMRRLIWRGVAVALLTGGLCWTVAQFQLCPRCPVARLLRSVLGCTRSADCSAGCSSQRAPVIVDLSAPWLKDPGALFPEDNLQLEDVIPSRERSKQLDLIDLSLLSEAAQPARPNYEEEDTADPFREILKNVSGPAENLGPEAPRVTLVESQPELASMTPADEGRSPRYMSYAAEEAEDLHLEEPPLAQEDPAARYDNPGCLQVDPCLGIEGKTRSNAPKATMPSSTPSRDQGAHARPTGIKYHTTLKKSIPAQEDSRPTHPEVDTMEFRPTDAGSVDFLHRKQVY